MAPKNKAAHDKVLKTIIGSLFRIDEHCTFTSLMSKNPNDAIFSAICNSSKSKNLKYPSQLYRFIHRHESDFKNLMPSQQISVLRAQDQLVIERNLQTIKSDPTTRKIESESVENWDRDRDDVLYLMKMQSVLSNYIQEVSVPFNVKIFSHEQLTVLSKSSTDRDLPLIYFDAMKPLGTNSRVFLYSAVIPLATGRIFPVFEMISASHCAKTIFLIWNDFRTFTEEQMERPIFGGVVTDFSYANLQAISYACNWLTLPEYLKKSYELLNDSVCTLPENFVTIHLCSLQVIKMFHKDIEICFSNKEVGSFIKDVMALAIDLTSIEQLDHWFTNVSILLSHSFQNEKLSCAKRKLAVLSEKIEKHSLIDFKEHEDFEEKKLNYDAELCHGSPFYSHFKKLVVKVEKLDVTGTVNIHYNKQFLDIILEKYMPFCSLWTGLMLKYRYPGIFHVSNTYSENYFENLKNTILNGEKNLKCSRFLRKSRENVLALFKEFDIEVPETKLEDIVLQHSLIPKMSPQPMETSFSSSICEEYKRLK